MILFQGATTHCSTTPAYSRKIINTPNRLDYTYIAYIHTVNIYSQGPPPW